MIHRSAPTPATMSVASTGRRMKAREGQSRRVGGRKSRMRATEVDGGGVMMEVIMMNILGRLATTAHGWRLSSGLRGARSTQRVHGSRS